MTNVTVLSRDSASAVHASEIDYAASMHFSAAYLPSGSSPSLEQEWSDTPSTPTKTTMYTPRLSNDSAQEMFGS